MFRYALIVATLTILPAFGVGLANYAIDPFQYFRYTGRLVSGISLFSSERFINPGLIKNLDYEGLIVGTSMIQNSSAAQVGAVFRKSFLNVGMGGSNFVEQGAVIRAAERFKKNGISHVLWGLDQRNWSIDPHIALNPQLFPTYLYQPSPMPLLRSYLLSKDVFALALNGIFKPKRPIALDTLYRWADAGYTFSCGTVRKTQHLDKAFEGANPAILSKNAAAQVAASIEPVIREFPETTFYLFIPPYSLAEYLRLFKDAPGVLEAVEPFAEHLAELPRRYPNVRVYDFRAWWDVVSNLDLFKDPLHYAPAINDLMTSYMATHDGLSSDKGFLARVAASSLDVFAQCAN